MLAEGWRDGLRVGRGGGTVAFGLGVADEDDHPGVEVNWLL